MSIDIIKLGGALDPSSIGAQDLAPLSFSSHATQTPAMNIWLMSMSPGLTFPWWKYDSRIDEDVQKLHKLWGVSSEQHLFDFLFFSHLKKIASDNLYVMFPGYIRSEGWDKVKDPARAAYQRGQGCVYRLEGELQKKLSINWVPFGQPQSLVRDPSLESLWQLFGAARSEDVANSLSFFSLQNPSALPQIVNLLVGTNENRSETLAGLVDWFGMYSSPLDDKHGTCAVVYSQNEEKISAFKAFQQRFSDTIEQARAELIKSPSPTTAFRLLSRFVAL